MSELSMTKNGIRVEVTVNAALGRFEAVVGADRVYADTWAGLEKLVDRATKKIASTVDIPFTQVVTHRHYGTSEVTVETRNGSATGLHSSSGHALVRWARSGKKEQLTGWRIPGLIARPLSSEEVEEYVRLVLAERAASEALRVWESGHKLDLKKAITDALDAAQAPDEE